MADPVIISYNRAPPPANPESAAVHLDGELGKLEITTQQLIASAALKADITYVDAQDAAEAAARTAADALKADITYVDAQDAAEAAARSAADALKADKTYVDAQDAAEAAARTAADALLAPLNSPAFTGTPTAPTQSAGDNSTKLATTAYADNAAPWKQSKSVSDQNISSTTFATVSGLTFPVAANKTYMARVAVAVKSPASAGGYRFSLSGPASPTLIVVEPGTGSGGASYGTAFTTVTPAGVDIYLVYRINIWFKNGANAGTVALTMAQQSASGTPTIAYAGSMIEWQQMD